MSGFNKGYQILPNVFAVSTKVIMYFSFTVNMVSLINWLLYVEPTLHCWNKSDLVTVCNPFDRVLDLIYKY
jgi:hypothetical protein